MKTADMHRATLYAHMVHRDPSRDIYSDIDSITGPEQQALCLLGQGMSVKEIVQLRDTTLGRLKQHIHSINTVRLRLYRPDNIDGYTSLTNSSVFIGMMYGAVPVPTPDDPEIGKYVDLCGEEFSQ